METLKQEALSIVKEAIDCVLPDAAVKQALKNHRFEGGRLFAVAIGKAAWNMASAAFDELGDAIESGIVLTKYDHAKGPIEKFEILEAGHPVPDEHSVRGAEKVLSLVKAIKPEDHLLFMLSGGGSAIFEMPMQGVTLSELMHLTNQLIRSGADIGEINSVRKHLSAVKGGRLAQQCAGHIFAIVLSDVLGDRLDVIASGPTVPDKSTSQMAIGILEKYGLSVSQSVSEALSIETPKHIENCETLIAGSVRTLCAAAAEAARKKGYTPYVVTTSLDGEAREVGRFFASMAQELCDDASLSAFKKPCAVIAGGETVVHVRGSGKGGRNQELALAAALGIEGLRDTVVVSVGSDGTDGPTDAAGGIVTGETAERIRRNGLDPEKELDKNNAYVALKASDDLIVTGATGTNVNDLTLLLHR